MSEYGDVDSPVFVGELRGYRKWVQGGDGLLRSVFVDEIWCDSIVAKCHYDFTLEDFFHQEDLAPHPECSCGVYAFYKPSPAEYYIGNIGGAIAASGTIIPGTKGFRAERARIEALVFEESHGGGNYPEVPIFPDWKSLIKEFPPSDVPWERR